MLGKVLAIRGITAVKAIGGDLKNCLKVGPELCPTYKEGHSALYERQVPKMTKWYVIPRHYQFGPLDHGKGGAPRP